MKKSVFAVAVALAGFALAQGPAEAPAFVQRRGPIAAWGDGFSDPVVRAVTNPQLAERLGLSAEQREKIAAIDKEGREGQGESVRKLRAAMEKQTALVQAPQPDEAAVMAAVDEVFELRKAMTKAQLSRTIKVKAVLTPEQAAKAADAVKEMREGRLNELREKARTARESRPAAPKAGAPKAGAPKAGAPKAGAPKAEAPKAEAAK